MRTDRDTMNAPTTLMQTHIVDFTDDQVNRVQEAIRRSQQDMNSWREQSKVDPQKMKEPLTR